MVLQADKYERKCRTYAAELKEAHGERDVREREAAAMTGQLAAAQSSHQLALQRLEQLAAALAGAQQDKVRGRVCWQVGVKMDIWARAKAA